MIPANQLQLVKGLFEVNVAVSGANGFLGSAIVDRLRRDRQKVHVLVRNTNSVNRKLVGSDVTSLLEPAAWQSALKECSVFIHCAARAHITSGPAKGSLPEFRKVNVDLTLELARQAAVAGVRRFVFVSSIGVNGRASHDRPFTPEDTENPHTPYALSKFEAEQGLHGIASETGLEIVIVRPPLVYGPNAPGNFGALTRIVRRGWPLPLGAVTQNRRSLVARDNLVDLLVTCADHAAAANQTFLVSDGEDLSTADLLRRLGRAMGRPARLWPVPTAWLRAGAYVLGQGDVAQRLLDNLQVDMTKTRRLLGWSPPIGVDEGLRRAVEGMGR